jgi:hypothetical protein
MTMIGKRGSHASGVFHEMTTSLLGRVDPAATSFGSASDLAEAMRRASGAPGEQQRRPGEADTNRPGWPDWPSVDMAAERAGTELSR